MLNAELLFDANYGIIKKVSLNHRRAVYRNRDREFDGKAIKRLLVFINTVRSRFNGVNVPITLDLGEVVFKDKLTYVFLEIICYILIKEYNHSVIVLFKCEHNIHIEGIDSSPLLLLGIDRKTNREKYVAKFNDDIFRKHYRRVVSMEDNLSTLSKIMSEVSYFLIHLGVSKKYVNKMAEVIAELVGNACEHTDTECLIDLDVTEVYYKKDSQETFFGVNLAVVNFSETLLGDAVKNRIMNPKEPLTERYDMVRKAFDSQEPYFGEKYGEDDFFNVASFQHKISGREDKGVTGGTGLTKLISSLEKMADSHRCYLITGNRSLWFFPEILEYNKDGWIGFNIENDFFSKPPTSGVLGDSLIYMPGTAYNLNFVIKKE